MLETTTLLAADRFSERHLPNLVTGLESMDSSQKRAVHKRVEESSNLQSDPATLFLEFYALDALARETAANEIDLP